MNTVEAMVAWREKYYEAERRAKEAYQRGLAEGRKFGREDYRTEHAAVLSAAYKQGREEERAAIVAWLRRGPPTCDCASCKVSYESCRLRAEAIESGDHLRPDIKDGEGEP